MPFTRPTLIALLAIGAIAGACTGAPAADPAPTQAPSPSPSAPPSAAPTVPPSAAPTDPPASRAPAGSVVVTFDVEGEEFRILLTDPDDIAIAERLLAGEEAPTIPNGLIVRGDPGVNEGYSWHIEPTSVEFADMTMEICDGLPSHVEDGTLAGDRYCPWGAVVVDVQPAD